MISVTAVGHLAADPEIREVNGKAVAGFRIGCRSGKDETSWVNCTVWGNRAATIESYYQKGSKVTVSGRGSVKVYQRKDGTEGQSLNIDVVDFTLPERKTDTEEAPF